PLRFRQVSEKLPGWCVAHFTGSALVETPGFCLHYFGMVPNGFDSQRPDHPHRLAVHESLHVFSPDQRDVLSKTATVVINQSAAMLILFRLHFLKDLGGRGVIGF